MSDQPKRRGRPPKDPADLKACNITMRFTEAMMDAVRDAAAASGLSLNGEVERRLAASFGFVSKASTQDSSGPTAEFIRQIVREEIAAALKAQNGLGLPEILEAYQSAAIPLRRYDHLPS